MSDPNDYTIGWICALEIEYIAALEFLDEEYGRPKQLHQNDETHYTLGKIGEHNIVIAVLPRGENGVVNAAAVARDMSHSFPNVRVCLMVGIGGGVPSQKHDIRLGDVVVSSPTDYEPGRIQGGVIQYDYGKTVRMQSFQGTRYLNKPPRSLLSATIGVNARYKRRGNGIDTAINNIIQNNQRLRKEYSRPDLNTDKLYSQDLSHALDDDAISMDTLIKRPERSEREDNPTIHYGLIASSDTFMEDSQVRDILAKELDVLCFEMEAAGLMNNTPCLVIRGICDYSDRYWSKDWRGYAAMTAAAYAKDIVKEVVLSSLQAEKSIKQLLDQS